MSKESFLLYHGYYEPVKNLSLEEKGLLFDAIFNYSISKVEPPKDSTIFMAFMFFKNQLDQDTKKYERISQERAEIGRKGGLIASSKRKQKVASGSKGKQSIANQADTDTVTVTDTETVTDFITWGNQIVNGEDMFWEQMKGRKVSRQEMDEFISVAVRKNWTLTTQQQFRSALKGFESFNKKQVVYKGLKV